MQLQFIGYVAAALTVSSFLHQVVHTVKVNQMKGLSLRMYGLFFVGTLCWLAYGVVILSAPIVIANALTASFSGAIFIMKLLSVINGSDN
ncbi:SemiSWEET family sugar transporter [Reinekea thalattae]|uniref:Glutathione synthetase n=1 Tax=Reinekea thalattae TaxID=2593301 RepID=A0A5C8Z9C1_9GAMM|nr:PQ-loop domain-containing transporter [Reinekea thalattae]TXR54317.1 hypothetical protein FME95_07210 [Reinekea thalattae]